MKKAIWALVVIALGIAAYLLFFNKPCACEEAPAVRFMRMLQPRGL